MSRYGELALEEVIYLADKPGLRLSSRSGSILIH
tara:strand:- start:1211 stop:1312 length:102 start_codon:yes stop_codon:yes gene_type:complete